MTQREDKQRARTSREELGKFFYNLALCVLERLYLEVE